MPTNLRIALVGCGAIGTEIAKAISALKMREVELTSIVDTDRFRAESLRRLLKPKPNIVDLDRAIQSADLIVEAANRRVIAEMVTKAIHQGKDVMLMSSGGLVDHLGLLDLARRKNCCIYLPSGAVAGVDGLKSAMAGKVRRVVLTTTKPPNGLQGAPYFQDHPVKLDRVKKSTIIFRGSARSAIRGFPANVNVCVCVALAGIGLDRTQVVIRVDPRTRVNRHELMVEGEFGRSVSITENVPSPLNPKTSFLAALSAVATFRRIIDPIKIGT